MIHPDRLVQVENREDREDNEGDHLLQHLEFGSQISFWRLLAPEASVHVAARAACRVYERALT
jgi:hypothetical protein